MNDFVLSDESKNSYGMAVLTSGINLEQFRKNPVMFYNHNRDGGVIGRWENIRAEGSRLLASPVFDESDETGKKVAKKVEAGFIRAASIGIDARKIDNGKTIVSCELIECSVCDIPSNGNAMMLYHQGKPVKDRNMYIKLKLINNQNVMSEEDLKKIIEALGLEPDAGIDGILDAVKSLQAAAKIIEGKTVNTTVEEAVQLNYVKAYERDGLLLMAGTNPNAFSGYIRERKAETLKERRREGEKLMEAALCDGRIVYDGKGITKDFWLKSFEYNFEGAKNALSLLEKPVKPMALIRPSGNANKTGWTLSDYRKKAPGDLQKDPELYKRPVKEEQEKQQY
jgi:hypothetical protein